MSNIKNLEKLYVEYLVNAKTEKEIVEWAINNYDLENNSALNKDILEVASLLTNSSETLNAPCLLKNIINRYSEDFDVRKETLAKEILQEQCQKLLDHAITPYQFCKIIGPLESSFNFPAWLGDLFNLCDWIEIDYILNEQMIGEVKERLKVLARELRNVQ